jgi:hypothetical protein
LQEALVEGGRDVEYKYVVVSEQEPRQLWSEGQVHFCRLHHLYVPPRWFPAAATAAAAVAAAAATAAAAAEGMSLLQQQQQLLQWQVLSAAVGNYNASCCRSGACKRQTAHDTAAIAAVLLDACCAAMWQGTLRCCHVLQGTLLCSHVLRHPAEVPCPEAPCCAATC